MLEQRAIICLHSINSLILSELAKLGKAAIRLVISVRPHETTRLQLEGFSLRDILLFFENLSRKFKFRENTTRITRAFHEELCTFLIYLSQFFLE